MLFSFGGDSAEVTRVLVKDSDGGLTEVGAATAIANWRTVHAYYEKEFQRAGIG